MLSEPVPPIAADTTLLVAASSFLESSSGLTDPRADLAFDAVVTAFCNGAQLFLPLPKHLAGDPIFLDLWRKSRGVTEICNLELNDEEFAFVAQEVMPVFADYIEGMPSQAARWVQFQFTDPCLVLRSQDSQAIRPHETTILRAGPVADSLLRSRQLERFSEAILHLEADPAFLGPGVYTHLLEAPEIRSFVHLCTAYAISFCVRGFSYALNLGLLESSPVYRHHWIRTPALKAERLIVGAPTLEINPPSWFPWGQILRSVFHPEFPLVQRTRGKATEVLAHLRAESARFRGELGAGGEVVRQANDRGPITDSEVYVLETLAGAGVYPRYRGSTGTKALAKWLRQLVEFELPLIRVPVEIITSSLQPQWARRVEESFRLRYRRDTFWDVFEHPAFPVRRNSRKQQRQ